MLTNNQIFKIDVFLNILAFYSNIQEGFLRYRKYQRMVEKNG